jgi:hypothetical protein
VAVVLDDQPPSGYGGLSLSGAASVNNGVYNYSNTTQYKTLKIETSFSNVADNGGIGIRKMAASRDKPWTMDDPAALKWQWRIVTGPTQNWPANNNSWYAFSETTKTLDLSTVSGLDADTRRNVQVRLKDSLGNISTADEGWITMGTIVYYTPFYSPVTDWSANYSDTANRITVTWTTPAGMTGVELSVNGGGASQIIGTGSKNHTINGVPKIDVSGVLSGQSVTGVTGYTITLTAYNAYGKADLTTVKIWNIPGMSVSNSYPAEEISTRAQLAAMVTGDAAKKYVLTDNITLTGTWTPRGTGSGTNAFQGKFYGNGHMISGLKPATVNYTGLFGYVDGAEIRDLKVVVEATAVLSLSGSTGYLGAVAGYANNSRMLNLMVEVPAGRVLGFTTTGSGGGNAGGVAGYLNNSTIDNCLAGGGRNAEGLRHRINFLLCGCRRYSGLYQRLKRPGELFLGSGGGTFERGIYDGSFIRRGACGRLRCLRQQPGLRHFPLPGRRQGDR